MFHIGHHFFGSGNIGDDLMLAGFLRAAPESLRHAGLSCNSPFDLECQRMRFPDIHWLPYDVALRAAAIASATAWLGVGDTPFQTDVGTWFLDHLIEDLAHCRRSNTPMFFVGVGVNHRAAVNHPRARPVIEGARRIWTRDALCTRALSTIRDVHTGADLANVYMADRVPPAIERGTVAFLLNFEDANAFTLEAIADVMDRTADRRHLWLVQEVRALQGSERDIYARLPARSRARLEVRTPDYAMGSTQALLDAWGGPEVVVTSRYHGALACAWMGSRLVVIERNDKLAGLVEALELSSARSFRSGEEVFNLVERAAPVSRPVLASLATLASESVRSLAEECHRLSA